MCSRLRKIKGISTSLDHPWCKLTTLTSFSGSIQSLRLFVGILEGGCCVQIIFGFVGLRFWVVKQKVGLTLLPRVCGLPHSRCESRLMLMRLTCLCMFAIASDVESLLAERARFLSSSWSPFCCLGGHEWHTKTAVSQLTRLSIPCEPKSPLATHEQSSRKNAISLIIVTWQLLRCKYKSTHQQIIYWQDIIILIITPSNLIKINLRLKFRRGFSNNLTISGV